MRTNSKIMVTAGAAAIALLALTGCGPTASDDTPSDGPGVEQPPVDNGPDMTTPAEPDDDATTPGMPGDDATDAPMTPTTPGGGATTTP